MARAVSEWKKIRPGVWRRWIEPPNPDPNVSDDYWQVERVGRRWVVSSTYDGANYIHQHEDTFRSLTEAKAYCEQIEEQDEEERAFFQDAFETA